MVKFEQKDEGVGISLANIGGKIFLSKLNR
jgi:hypothetical protein